jgi:hypothetical protein
MTSRVRRATVAATITVLLAASCARPKPRLVAPEASQSAPALLWEDPGDLAERDLFHGPGGPALAPRADVTYTYVAADQAGYSAGYDVRGPDGLIWSVKLGPEAQPEIVASRVLWAIGYQQPPTYYLPNWTLAHKATSRQPAGRFRPKLTEWNVLDDWSWYQNEFVGTQPFNALVVANVILNSWDWKTSNNKVYEVNANGTRRRLYVVRDLCASLWKTTFPAFLGWFPMRGFGQGTRNDLEGFESQRLLKRVKAGELEFDYRGIHKPLLDSLSAADVVWACRLMSRISDEQWHDAFRAADYGDDHRQRYVKKIKQKIAEGLSLTVP